MKDETNPGSIVGRYEVAQIIGITRQGVVPYLDHPDFPPPICKHGKAKSPLFYRRDVLRFKAELDASKARA